MNMNTKKNINYGLTALLFAVVFAFIFTACPEKNDDDKKYAFPHDDEGVPMFGTKTARIKTDDNFTVDEWNGIKSAIAGKFAAGYNTDNDNVKLAYRNAFEISGGATIIVEKNPTTYTNYKVADRILRIRSDKVDTLNTIDIITALINNTPLNAKAFPARETPRLNRQAVAFGNEKVRIIGWRV